MKVEQFAFPLVVVASIATLWLVFRRGSSAAVAAPADTGTLSPGLPSYGYAPAPLYLPPTRLVPPATSPLGPPNTLEIPPGLTAAQAIGIGGGYGTSGSGAGGGGCCC